jgi:predicted phage-related endonuclease
MKQVEKVWAELSAKEQEVETPQEVELSEEQKVELSLLDDIKSKINALKESTADLGNDSREIISARSRMVKKIDTIESRIKPINSMISDYEAKLKDLGIDDMPKVIFNANNELARIRKTTQQFRSEFLER